MPAAPHDHKEQRAFLGWKSIKKDIGKGCLLA